MSEASLRERLRLMVITDPAAPSGVPAAVEAALAGGATAIQLRSKGGSTRAMVELGRELRRLTREVSALLLVNDRVDVALAVEADGAHLGDDDLPLPVARRITPAGFVLGRSVDNAAEAVAAAREGADYLGLGPVFPTRSKDGLGEAIGPAGVVEVRASVELPFVGIGGIDAENAASVAAAGADGIAVIGAVMMSSDPGRSARELLNAFERGRASAS